MILDFTNSYARVDSNMFIGNGVSKLGYSFICHIMAKLQSQFIYGYNSLSKAKKAIETQLAIRNLQ